jgi:hypothetical protein
MRIVAASSKAGDCVLDPFAGSGTTAVAAKKLHRNYVGIEISADYVKKAKQRLEQLDACARIEKEHKLNIVEIGELKRLIPDIGYPPKQVLSNNDLLELFTNQFAIRMNNQKQYVSSEIATALKGITD